MKDPIDNIKDIDWRLFTAVDRLRHYQARFEPRSVEIQQQVVDRLLDERLRLMPPVDNAHPNTMIGK